MGRRHVDYSESVCVALCYKKLVLCVPFVAEGGQGAVVQEQIVPPSPPFVQEAFCTGGGGCMF